MTTFATLMPLQSKKWSKKPRPKLATLLWWAGAGKIYRAPSAFDGFG